VLFPRFQEVGRTRPVDASGLAATLVKDALAELLLVAGEFGERVLDEGRRQAARIHRPGAAHLLEAREPATSPACR
jgi:hypothetical protein